MNAHTLGTYRLVQKLKGAGCSEEQARAVRDALRETREFGLSALAAKADILALEAGIRGLEAAARGDIRALDASTRAELRKLEAAINGRIADSRRVMVQWAVGLFLAQLACVAVLIKFLH